MVEEKAKFNKPHNIVLENRKFLSVSGVEDIIKFDETLVMLSTSLGDLTISGENLHISKSSIESGELTLDGEISELLYSAKQQPSGGLFSKFFK